MKSIWPTQTHPLLTQGELYSTGSCWVCQALELGLPGFVLGLQASCWVCQAFCWVCQASRWVCQASRWVCQALELGLPGFGVGSARLWSWVCQALELGPPGFGVGSARLSVGSARLRVGSARLRVGSARLSVGSARLSVGSARLSVGSARLCVGSALGPKSFVVSFLSTNMLVTARIRGLEQHGVFCDLVEYYYRLYSLQIENLCLPLKTLKHETMPMKPMKT